MLFFCSLTLKTVAASSGKFCKHNLLAMRGKVSARNGKGGQHLESTMRAISDARSHRKFPPFTIPPEAMNAENYSPLIACHTATKLHLKFFTMHKFFGSMDGVKHSHGLMKMF